MEELPKKRPVSRGTCGFCGGTFSKGTMTRHLATCAQRVTAAPAPAGRRWARPPAFHLLVAGRYQPAYWLHLETPATSRLEDLDDFLRRIWLECCGHLSAFRIEDTHYVRGLDGDVGDLGDEDMDFPLGEVLRPGLSFAHDYDFGTTTELTLRTLSEIEGTAPDRSIRVLARNLPPPIACQTWGRPATQVCSQCIYEDAGWLCDACAAAHACGEEMLLPVVNSPRVGLCSYTGPAEP